MSSSAIIAIAVAVAVVVVVALLLNRRISIKGPSGTALDAGSAGPVQRVRASGKSTVARVEQEGSVGEQDVEASDGSYLADVKQKNTK